MPDIFGKKKIGDLEGTILCTNTAYDVECMVDSSGEKSVYNWYGQTTKEYACVTDEITYKGNGCTRNDAGRNSVDSLWKCDN